MKILITGATGFVGRRLIETLMTSGYEDIRILTRNKNKCIENKEFPIDVFEWNPLTNYIEVGALDGVDHIIHLAGEGVADGRWNSKKKEMILSSRVKGTKTLINAIERSGTIPTKFISASAIGIYGNRFTEALDTDSSLGSDYLANVCKKWEKLCLNHNINGMKSICLRVGIVLGEGGGALSKMLPPFKAGVAGRLGSGDQYMSWIHIDDLVSQMIFLIENETNEQIFNGVSPTPVTNSDFTKTLGSVLHRPTIFPVPSFALKLLFGEMSQILLNSQNVIPANFIKNGYKYKYTNLKDALENILEHSLKGEQVLKRYQWVSKGPDEVFSFFSDETNLEEITPNYLNFKVVKKSTPELTEGTLIDYKLKVRGLPMKWRSRINSFVTQKSFVDEQIHGPYSKWHHTHEFFPLSKGTLMKDNIIYKVPMGPFGHILSKLFINRDLNNIFKFRRTKINQLFS
jgi:uncharacterized protein (TIGR01777 family)